MTRRFKRVREELEINGAALLIKDTPPFRKNNRQN